MKKSAAFLAAVLLCGLGHAAVNTFDIQVNRPGADIAPTMYGLFFEDINFGADGGLYAEMVKNRSFEFPDALMGWRSFGHVDVLDDGPFSRNPHYVRLSSPGHREKRTGLDNEGFFGVAFGKVRPTASASGPSVPPMPIRASSWSSSIRQPMPTRRSAQK